MSKKLIEDLTIGIVAIYGVPDSTAKKVARQISRWALEQLAGAGIPLPTDAESQDERYSLLIGRLVQSEVVAARVAFEK